MKENLIKLIDGMTESQIVYLFVFVSKMFIKGGVYNGKSN